MPLSTELAETIQKHKDRVLALLQTNQHTREYIATTVGVSLNTVRRVANDNGFNLPIGRPPKAKS